MQKILIVLLLVFFQMAVTAQSVAKETDIVGYVNKEPVTAEEYALFAQRNRHAVITHFRNNKKLKYHANFWTDKSKGKTPGEVLKAMTMDSIVSIKVQYILARQYGIINDISFQSIKQNLENENQYRRQALKQNVVIYGPEQYTMENYYYYLTSNMVIKLKDYMVRKGLITVDVSKGITKTNNSTMHDDDKYYSKVHIANTQINEQYKIIIQQLIKDAKVKLK